MPKKTASETDERISLSVRVPRDIYQAVAIYCVQNRLSHQEILFEGLQLAMKKRKIAVE